MAKIDLRNIPVYAKVIILVLVVLIPVVAFYFLVYSPKTKEIKQLDAKISKLDNEIATAQVKVRRLDELKVEYEKLKLQLAALREIMPEEEEVSVLLKQISDLGLTSGLVIALWKPVSRIPDPEGVYVEIPVQVEVMGGYHDLGVFYSHISRMPRLVNIANIKLSLPRQKTTEKQLINAVFTASTFSAVKESEQKEVAQTGKNVKSRKSRQSRRRR
ncbi:MAG: type 4a pilus biogenesis protein PilO [Nitrospiraceae bacterium]|nr:MAG: type 4a pilus biogenesis protein PilO [Nitrospiraceae bacterium]